jgi:hypothetical protein
MTLSRSVYVYSTRPQAIDVVVPVLRNHANEAVARNESIANEGQKRSVFVVSRREESADVPGVPEK